MSTPPFTRMAPGSGFALPSLPATPAPATPTPTTRGRGTGAKRGRKPRGATPAGVPASLAHQHAPSPTQGLQFTPEQWAVPAGPVAASGESDGEGAPIGSEKTVMPLSAGALGNLPVGGAFGSAGSSSVIGGQHAVAPQATKQPDAADEEGEDEMLPAMADDDYSAQLSWQSESKDNLKVLMDNFSPAQYDRFEAYRRHALPKQAIRRVIQQTTGQQVSQPVAQVIAGFAKVFVGEIVETARAVQARRSDTGPLSPDHLREAYRIYQNETGRVGSARPSRGRRLFHR